MKIALFGGSGFVGRKVLENLQANFADIIEISRHPLSNRSYQADIAQLDSLYAIKENIDCVVICSSHLPQREYHLEDFSHFVDVNIKGICNILIWAAERRARKIIYCSTLSFLPSRVEDESELIDTNAHYLYKISKAAGEHLVIGFCKERNMECISLRIASVYGPGMKSDVVHLFYKKIMRGEKIVVQNSGYQVDFIHVEDVARLVLLCCHGPMKKIVNVSSGSFISLTELVHMIAKITNQPVPLIEIKSTDPIFQKIYSNKTLVTALTNVTPLEVGLRELISTW